MEYIKFWKKAHRKQDAEIHTNWKLMERDYENDTLALLCRSSSDDLRLREPRTTKEIRSSAVLIKCSRSLTTAEMSTSRALEKESAVSYFTTFIVLKEIRNSSETNNNSNSIRRGRAQWHFLKAA